MYVKLMTNDGKNDNDQGKLFSMVPIGAKDYFKFAKVDGKVCLVINTWLGEELITPLEGNAYVMNTDGKTIASYGWPQEA